MLHCTILNLYQQYFSKPYLLELIMIAKLCIVAVASTLLLTASAANAANADNATERSSHQKSAECVVPYYPATWQQEGMEGNVRLAVRVDAAGAVKEAKVVESSGYRALDRASLRAGYSCKFGTVSKNTDSASAWTTVQYKWVVN
jgi:protein TonB